MHDAVRWGWWVWTWKWRVWEEEQQVGSAWRRKERLMLSSKPLLLEEEVSGICCRSYTSPLHRRAQ